MNNEQLDSQLSAMFDDELPEPECELLARRLARDEGLKARWGRYAVIAACVRLERGGETPTSVRAAFAGRVSKMIAAEPPLLAGTGVGRSVRGLAHPAVSRWWQPAAGGAVVAAGVAAAAILWLRGGPPDAPISVRTPVLARTANPVAAPRSTASGVVQVAKVTSSGPASTAVPSTPDSFVVPPPARSPSFAPPVELANFVVAHSEYSMPLLRHSALSALVADEPLPDDAAESSSAAPDQSSSGADGAGKAADAPHADPPR